MKKTTKLLIAATSLIATVTISHHIGYNTAVMSAEPFIEDDRYLVSYGDEVHDYGYTTQTHITSVAGRITFYDDKNLQFESYDGETRWYLTREDASVTPNYTDTFVLTYDDYGTTSCNHSDCECYLYDDEFVMIERA